MAKAASTPPIESVRAVIETLVPNPRNPRAHPAEQIAKLAASVKRFGQTRPVLVRRENRMIVAGHGVTEACRQAGLTEIDVLLWDVDQKTADAFMVGDNKLGTLGRDVEARVRDLLREHGMTDIASIGYDAAEAEALLRDAATDIEIVEIATHDVEDRFWISVRGPLASQAKALSALRDSMKQLPDVEIELGTTAHE